MNITDATLFCSVNLVCASVILYLFIGASGHFTHRDREREEQHSLEAHSSEVPEESLE